MARHPMWSQDEWALLVDLALRWEDEVPEDEIERAHELLRASAFMSEDAQLRRQAADPSFRSLGGVWTQYYHVRRIRHRSRRHWAPLMLRRALTELAEDPDLVHERARAFRERIEGGANPYRVHDDAAVRLFLADANALLDETVQLLPTLKGIQASERLLRAHTAAWADLRERRAVESILDEIATEVPGALRRAGLTGVQLAFKLTGWMDALREWRGTRALNALKRAFQWADVILGSLGSIVAGPGLEIFREFKEGTETVLEETVPAGGYLPAPAFA